MFDMQLLRNCGYGRRGYRLTSLWDSGGATSNFAIPRVLVGAVPDL
jgi:hypothetical protein